VGGYNTIVVFLEGDYWLEKRFFMSGIKGLIGRFLSIVKRFVLMGVKTLINFCFKTVTYKNIEFFSSLPPKVLVWADVNRNKTKSVFVCLNR